MTPYTCALAVVTALTLAAAPTSPSVWLGGSTVLLGIAGFTLLTRPRPAPPAMLWLVSAAVFFGASAASVTWSSDRTASVHAVALVLLYLSVIVAFTARRTSCERGTALGVLAAISLTCGVALVQHLCPDVFAVHLSGWSAGRLYLPLGYWNATGAFAAIGIVIAVGLAACAETARGRAVLAACVPMLALVVYLTLSRGAIASLFAGLACLVALSRNRHSCGYLIATLTPLGVGAAALAHHATLITGPRYGVVAASEGHLLLVETAVLCLLAGAITYGTASRETPRPISRLLGATGVVLAVLVAGVAAARVHLVDTATSRTDARLLDTSANGRVGIWRVAVRDFETHPFTGSGAGTFHHRWLLAHPEGFDPVWSHSLELGVLAELGLIGAVPCVLLLAVPLVAGVRRRSSPVIAPLLGGYVVYLVHSTVDWDWQVPALTVAALICASQLPPAPASLNHDEHGSLTGASDFAGPATKGL